MAVPEKRRDQTNNRLVTGEVQINPFKPAQGNE